MRRTPWLTAFSLCLGALGCTQVEPSPRVSAPRPSVSAALEEQEPEPTFELLPSPEELVERMHEHLRDPVDTEEEWNALAQVQEELHGFQYTPSSEVVVPEPEEPLGESFGADSQSVEARLESLFGGRVVVSCGLPPCILYGDFDGDGRRDQAVQVMHKTRQADQVTLLFLLANERHALLDVQQTNDKGDDLLWVLDWKVLPSNPEQPRATLRLDGVENSQALVQVDEGGKISFTWVRRPGESVK
jgi:hypothetical protein